MPKPLSSQLSDITLYYTEREPCKANVGDATYICLCDCYECTKITLQHLKKRKEKKKQTQEFRLLQSDGYEASICQFFVKGGEKKK
jgi:hypothetical protein